MAQDTFVERNEYPMAKKKSAAQKGFRKQAKAKPFITKKEIYELIIIAAVILLAVVLFNLFYDDGFMSARQVKENDLVTYASTENRSRYKKIAEVGEMDGFTRSTTAQGSTPIATFRFEPETDMGNLAAVEVSASFVAAETLTNSFAASIGEFGLEVMDPIVTTINDHQAYVFAYESAYYSAENDPDAVEGETVDVNAMPDNTFMQYITAYINVEDTHTAKLQAEMSFEDADSYMPHEEIEAYLLQYADVINLDYAAK